MVGSVSQRWVIPKPCSSRAGAARSVGDHALKHSVAEGSILSCKRINLVVLHKGVWRAPCGSPANLFEGRISLEGCSGGRSADRVSHYAGGGFYTPCLVDFADSLPHPSRDRGRRHLETLFPRLKGDRVLQSF